MTTFFLLILVTCLLPLTRAEMFANVLAIQWPVTACKLFSDCDHASLEYLTDFTIHGLWPLAPTDYECRGWLEQKVSRLTQEPMLKYKLNTFWPSFSPSFGNTKFWLSEWNSHARCTEPLMDFKDYFLKSIVLFEALRSPLMLLNTAGIVPGISYTYADLLVLTKRVPHKPTLACKGDANTGDQLIAELRFCVDPVGTEILDCADVVCD